MAATFITLKASGLISETGTLRDEYVPATGEICTLVEFIGHGAFRSSSVVAVVFDDAGTPEVLWSTHGDIENYGLAETLTGTPNGVRKLELILDNSNSQEPVVMTGKAVIKVTS